MNESKPELVGTLLMQTVSHRPIESKEHGVHLFGQVYNSNLGRKREELEQMHHRLWLRLVEKGSKHHKVPCHHNLEQYLREYIDAAGIEEGPLCRTLRGRSGQLNEKRLHRTECLAMIKRR